jgi:hypothetical protein
MHMLDIKIKIIFRKACRHPNQTQLTKFGMEVDN